MFSARRTENHYDESHYVKEAVNLTLAFETLSNVNVCILDKTVFRCLDKLNKKLELGFPAMGNHEFVQTQHTKAHPKFADLVRARNQMDIELYNYYKKRLDGESV